jgi:pimeloyl-ACP methyl ester carboxylesterase
VKLDVDVRDSVGQAPIGERCLNDLHSSHPGNVSGAVPSPDERAHRMTVRRQHLSQPAADESGRPRDEHARHWTGRCQQPRLAMSLCRPPVRHGLQGWTVLVRQSGLDRGEIAFDRFAIPFAAMGDGSQCLICVNAVQQTMGAWRPFLSRFGSDPRYRVVLFDFPNQGRARICSGDVEVSLMEQVSILTAVAQRLSPYAPVNLIGGSWGSVVAAAFAATSPSRVANLVLGSFQTKSNPRLCEISRRGIALVNQGDRDGLGALFVEGFGARMRPASQQRLREQFRRLTRNQLSQVVLQGNVLLEFGDIETFVDLSAIRARTLIVNGADDPIVDVEDVWVASSRIPDCETQILPGAGHFLHIEDPAIMDVYADFLDRR